MMAPFRTTRDRDAVASGYQLPETNRELLFGLNSTWAFFQLSRVRNFMYAAAACVHALFCVQLHNYNTYVSVATDHVCL